MRSHIVDRDSPIRDAQQSEVFFPRSPGVDSPASALKEILAQESLLAILKVVFENISKKACVAVRPNVDDFERGLTILK
jgi:hypothetical protein